MQGVGAQIIDIAQLCRQGVFDAGTSQPEMPELPLIGELDADELSLPFFTLVLAGLDAFNPCAFFILLFLLSLLVHARSRRRMLLVGMTFVLVSGIVYFLFMAAWLNLFLLIGGVTWMTLAAGLLALLIGLMNIKEFYFFRQGPSLSIPDSAKPGLFRRMTRLISVDRLPALLGGTLVLALVANSYELLCTAGFPMVYTRTLTLHELAPATYYLYLGFYNVVYVLPLLAIVLVFTFTLGARKLTQGEGRFLKLLSGLMMFLLGTVLVLAPDRLSDMLTGVWLLLAALLLGTGAWLMERWRRT